ncbi:recombinase family protein [Nakamurella sp.]|uniref:recombinase family protein n=1 Tax=Nakamurella sp. TaxID=1869182 RepID=UPI0037837CB8
MSTQKAVVGVALYARMSKDNELGIARQLQDARAEAARQGWTIVGEYVDDGVSATNGKDRPQYLRLLAAVKRGAMDAVIVWDQDRLSRDPDELRPWLDLTEAGLRCIDVDGRDLFADRFNARVGAARAEEEVRKLKRRLRRSLAQRAQTGKPHGPVRYGWRCELIDTGTRRVRVGTDQLDPEPAEVIRETAKRLLEGESVRSISADLNRRGLTTTGGGRWTGAQLRTVMLRPRNAGIRVHRGEEIGVGDWPPIYDRDTHDRVAALLTNPARTQNRGSERKHLLSLLARCGRCDTPTMIVNTGGTSTRRPYYVCRDCHRCARVQEPVDELVSEMMIARLSQPDAISVLTPPDRADDLADAENRHAAIKARLDLAADQYADDLITADQLGRISARLTAQMDAIRTQITALLPRADLGELAGPDARAKWESASLDVRRAAIDTLLVITILPEAPKGRAPFNPESVRVEWRA